MRNTLREYYHPSDVEFTKLWDDSLFVFDANILLNIYRYSQKTRETFLDILEKFSDRIWVPHQAAMEYQQRRLDVIGKQESAYTEIQDLLNQSLNKINNELNSYKKHPFIEVKNIIEKTNENHEHIKNKLNTLKETHPKLTDVDELRDSITKLFEGKVGLPYSPKKLEEIYKEGKIRYERDIPPGFKDQTKNNVREYGDLILWFQIIDYAKSSKKSIIFITDDGKEDWWLKFKGKIISPRPELIKEMFTIANVNFYMYQTERFIENSHKYLKEKVDQTAIDEIREIKLYDEDRIGEKLQKLMQTTAQILKEEEKEKKKYNSFIHTFMEVSKKLEEERGKIKKQLDTENE